MSQHSFVLSRRVRRDPEQAERALPGLAPGDYAGLRLLSSFERRSITGPWGSGAPDRQAAAELTIAPRRSERVEVELAAWARDAVEIRVRPVSRRPERWSGRRQTRYFERAHEAVDALARALERDTPAPTAIPVRRSA
jgi:hypothetical protein